MSNINNRDQRNQEKLTMLFSGSKFDNKAWTEQALAQLQWLTDFVNLNEKILRERGQFDKLLAEIHTAIMNVEADFYTESEKYHLFFDKKWLTNAYKATEAERERLGK